MLQKSYIQKISPAAMKTFRQMVTNANIQALVDDDRAKIDHLREIYSLYHSIHVSFNNKDLTD